jgi:hypothetical protein
MPDAPANTSTMVFDDSDSAYVSEDDSPEMKTLNKEARQRTTTRTAGESLTVPSSRLSPLKSAEEMFRPGYTVPFAGIYYLNVLNVNVSLRLWFSMNACS